MGQKVGRSETDATVWTSCQNSARQCGGRPGSARQSQLCGVTSVSITAGPNKALQEIGYTAPNRAAAVQTDQT